MLHEISIKDILNKIKFHNTSYREYLGRYKDYIIGIHPFAIAICDAYLHKIPVFYEDIKYSRTINIRQYHHYDFKNDKIDCTNFYKNTPNYIEEFIYDIDPCEAYEIISNTKIHHSGSDKHMMHKIHTEDILLFECDVRSYKRNLWLNELNI